MENPFEVLLKRIEDLENLILDRTKPTTDPHTGVDLDRYISLKKVCEMYGVVAKTLAAHKNEIEHVRRFKQIYFLKESLSQYMEAGRPEPKKAKQFKYTNRRAS